VLKLAGRDAGAPRRRPLTSAIKPIFQAVLRLAPRPSTLVTFLVLAWSFSNAFAQPSMVTILTNGPASNRLNIVVLSEGYTNNQLAQFRLDATNVINGLFSHSPYQEYRSYCNAFAISVPSNQSGSDHPADGPSSSNFRDTYFNSTYDSTSDYFITIPPNFADGNYSHGQGKVDTLLQTFMPRCQLPVLLVNDVRPGGSDGFDKTAISYRGFSSSDIVTHETGHVLANLGDEYTNAYPGFPDTEEPNTTRETRPDFIKWKAWIPENTPLPTPPTAQYASVIGLFQGAHYHPTNWYRPKLNCTMNHNASPFCEVCAEALVLAIYQQVRPIDSFAPANTNLSISAPQPVAFNLSLLRPLTHDLDVQWLTNGTVVAGATNAAFTLAPQSLANGTGVVTAIVKDNTPLVRNDPTNLLSQTVAWTLVVNLPQLQLDSLRSLPGGQFAFRLSGNAPAGFSLQASTNLSDWVSLQTNSLVAGQFWYTNSNIAVPPIRFFRAVTPP
jgi:hypothetical protein